MVTDWSKVMRDLNKSTQDAKDEQLQLLQNYINNNKVKDVFITQYALVLNLENNKQF